MTLTKRQHASLCRVVAGGFLWQTKHPLVIYMGSNAVGNHYCSPDAVDLFAAGMIDKRGQITSAGRQALDIRNKKGNNS